MGNKKAVVYVDMELLEKCREIVKKKYPDAYSVLNGRYWKTQMLNFLLKELLEKEEELLNEKKSKN